MLPVAQVQAAELRVARLVVQVAQEVVVVASVADLVVVVALECLGPSNTFR